MKYNKSIIRTKVVKFLRKEFEKRTGYYIYPKWRALRDLDLDKEYELLGDEKLINLGGGEFFDHPRWINYDLYEPELLERIPNYRNYDFTDVDNAEIPEENVAIVYTEHTLEHIPMDKIGKTIERVYDCLKPGGILRIIVPDAGAVIDAYDNNDWDYFKPYQSWFLNRGGEPSLEDYLLQIVATPKTNFLNEKTLGRDGPEISPFKLTPEDVKILRKEANSKEEFLDSLLKGCDKNYSTGVAHLNWFDEKKLTDILLKAGFSDVYKSGFGQSKSLILRQVPLFDSWLPFLSLYIEAKK